MFDFQVETPILNTPYNEPKAHWRIVEGEEPRIVEERRRASYFYRPVRASTTDEENEDIGTEIELLMVNRIRERVRQWREEGYPGATKISLELLGWWRREGRAQNLFFAQIEAAETVIFLTEARADLRQGIQVELDEPSDGQREEGIKALKRYACKMATGSGKTTVMGMLAAWSILNKVASGGRDARYSDFVLIVAPNVTIRSRLGEIDPARGEGSLYRTRDLVPPHLMLQLSQGRVLVTNWHNFELQDEGGAGGVSARVVRKGRELRTRQRVRIGEKTTTQRGSRYMPLETYRKLQTLELLEVINEERDEQGNLLGAEVIETRYVESDAKWLRRVLDAGARKSNILVMNDEAHHAYRLKSEDDEFDDGDEDDFADAYYREATVWIEGVDRINRLAGVGQVLDFSATPYYLGRAGGNMANRPFPWVVSDFGLIEAIESGLTKIPQFAARDLTGAPIPGYFNIWRWILPQLKASERGGKKAMAKPEAILRYAHTPLAMLGGLWQQLAAEWKAGGTEERPPVFIIVCKNIKLAKLVYEWLALDRPPAGVPSAGMVDFLNSPEHVNTIRVDNTVSSETDSGHAKADEDRWMRFTLDTVGKLDWPRNLNGQPAFPEGFEALATKLGRPMTPPGRDVRAIVSVGMLTEGWDCNTVTHIVGLRPFMSQLLCEQVVGRGLRRASYETGDDGKLGEEIAQIFGVPFQVVPFKAQAKGTPKPPAKTWRVRALPERTKLEIKFPRVEGYSVQGSLDPVISDKAWKAIQEIKIDPTEIPPQVTMKAGLPGNDGRPTVTGPGRIDTISLAAWREEYREQTQMAYAARDLLRQYLHRINAVPAGNVYLFRQFVGFVRRFVDACVKAHKPAQKSDVFLAPYYGLMQERLLNALTNQANESLLPRYEMHRRPGSTGDVDYTTRKEPMPVIKSHLNYVVADSRWERIAASALEDHEMVEAFAKNNGLGFTIPYFDRGTPHDYLPDFVVKIKGQSKYLLLEIKGRSTVQTEAKSDAAARWCEAVSREGSFGTWKFLQLEERASIPEELDKVLAKSKREQNLGMHA
jgi:type III restriction enzyme